ncbi:MAG: BatA domain-containing protein [Planctomycetota bacterium]|nr:BatA domain-containing protein [Planctomycetota bacterium]
MFAFLNPALLWTGLGLMSVPIVIHLFFRHRHQRIRWAAMSFLLAALRKQKRRIRMENLLLLLLRCALVALLGLALARPQASAGLLASLTSGSRNIVLILDTSASMAARHTGRTAFRRAQEQASELLKSLGDSSKVTLVVTRDPELGGVPRAPIERAHPDDVRRRLGSLRTTHGPNRLGEVIRLAGQKAAEMTGRRLLIFVTDLQKRDWRNAEGSIYEDLRRSLRSLRRGDQEAPPLVVLDVGRSGLANVVIEDFTRVEGREPIAGQAVGLAVRVVNYGGEEAAGNLTLYRAREMDGTFQKLDSQAAKIKRTVGVGSPSFEEHAFYVTLEEGSDGPLRFRVAFEGSEGGRDRIEEDSRRQLALRVRQPLRILPVRTFSYALKLLDLVSNEPWLDWLDPVRPADLSKADLGKVDLVVWADADVDGLDAEGVFNLETFVRRGGGLLAYTGTFTAAAPANRLFFKERGQGLFPMLLGAPVELDLESAVELDLTKEIHHPLFSGMTSDARARTFFGYNPLRITWYRPVTGYPEDAVVARWTSADDAPAVLTHRLGRGRVVVVTTTPDERFKILNGSLIPPLFFLDATHFLVSEDDSHRNVSVGAPITVLLPSTTRNVTVERPEGAGGTLVEPIADASAPFSFTDTAYPGFYRFSMETAVAPGATPGTAVHVAAVNVEAQEGDLRRASFTELQRNLPGVDLHLAEQATDAIPQRETHVRSELGRALLAGVGILLLVEMLMAWRFGSRRRWQA